MKAKTVKEIEAAMEAMMLAAQEKAKELLGQNVECVILMNAAPAARLVSNCPSLLHTRDLLDKVSRRILDDVLSGRGLPEPGDN